MQLNLLPTVQQAISNLLTVYEPEFLRFGYSLFLSFATILIVWHGIKMMFSHDSLGDSMFDFAKLLMLISFGYAFIAFYESPIPGIGVSFSNLITDQTAYFQSVLEARAFDNIYRHLDDLSDHFMQPDAWSILHRAKVGMAVLGLAEILHPVLVRAGGGDRVPDDLRAVRLPLRNHPAAHDHVCRVRRLRPSGGRCRADFLFGDRVGPVADQLDLLGSGRTEHSVVRAAPDSPSRERQG